MKATTPMTTSKRIAKAGRRHIKVTDKPAKKKESK